MRKNYYDAAANSIGEFSSNPEEITFAGYFHRYKDVFRKECMGLVVKKTVSLVSKIEPGKP